MSENDEIDELLIDWYDYEADYGIKLGYDRASAMCRDYRTRWQDSDDQADRAQAAARKAVCEAVAACVARLDIRYRIALQTVLRNWRSGAQVWSSIRIAHDPEADYAEAKKLLIPMLYQKNLIDSVDLLREKV